MVVSVLRPRGRLHAFTRSVKRAFSEVLIVRPSSLTLTSRSRSEATRIRSLNAVFTHGPPLPVFVRTVTSGGPPTVTTGGAGRTVVVSPGALQAPATGALFASPL